MCYHVISHSGIIDGNWYLRESNLHIYVDEAYVLHYWLYVILVLLCLHW